MNTSSVIPTMYAVSSEECNIILPWCSKTVFLEAHSNSRHKFVNVFLWTESCVKLVCPFLLSHRSIQQLRIKKKRMQILNLSDNYEVLDKRNCWKKAQVQPHPTLPPNTHNCSKNIALQENHKITWCSFCVWRRMREISIS